MMKMMNQMRLSALTISKFKVAFTISETQWMALGETLRRETMGRKGRRKIWEMQMEKEKEREETNGENGGKKGRILTYFVPAVQRCTLQAAFTSVHLTVLPAQSADVSGPYVWENYSLVQHIHHRLSDVCVSRRLPQRNVSDWSQIEFRRGRGTASPFRSLGRPRTSACSQ